MGVHAPGRKTSGARPFSARGCTRGSSYSDILAPGFAFAARPRFACLPWVASVVIQAHIPARARRAAETNLVPRRGLGVIGAYDVVQEPLLEEESRRYAAPGV